MDEVRQDVGEIVASIRWDEIYAEARRRTMRDMTGTEQQRGCGRPAISEKLLGSAQQERVEEIVPLELLPRTARNRFGQVAKLWTTVGLERQLGFRTHLQEQAS